MKVLFPSPRPQHTMSGDPSVDVVLQDPARKGDRKKAQETLNMTPESLTRAAGQLKKTSVAPEVEIYRQRRKTRLIQKLEAQCDRISLSQVGVQTESKAAEQLPKFEIANTILTKLCLSKEELLIQLESNFRKFVRKPLKTQQDRDVLLDAMLKTSDEWKKELRSALEDFGVPTGSMSRITEKNKSPRDEALEKEIDDLANAFRQILIDHGPNSLEDDGNRLKFEGQEFLKEKPLGRGSNGSVSKYRNLETGETLVVKSPLYGAQSGKSMLDKFSHQIRLHRIATSPNPEQNKWMTPLKGAVLDHSGLVHAVMAEGKGGDVQQLLRTLDYLMALNIVPYSVRMAVQRSICAQAAQGIDELHEKGLVHGDIKAANLVIDEKGRVRLTDFDLTEVASPQTLSTQARLLATKARILKALGKQTMYDDKVPPTHDRKRDVYSMNYLLPGVEPEELSTDMNSYVQWRKRNKTTAVGRLYSKTTGEETSSALIPTSKGLVGSAYLNMEDIDQHQMDALIQAVIEFRNSLPETEVNAIKRFAEEGGLREHFDLEGYSRGVNDLRRTSTEAENANKIQHMRLIREKADTSGFTARLMELARPFRV